MLDSPEIAPWIISGGVVIAALTVNGLVGLGVEASKRTKIPGVFAAGWLTLMQGLGFWALWGLDSFAHGVVLGIGFIALGLGMVSLPIVHREMERGSGGEQRVQ